MGKIVAQVLIRDNGDLRDLSRMLRKHGDAKALRRELTKGIRKEIKPLEKKAKQAYRGNPSQHNTRRLRPALARAVKTEVRTGGKHAGALIRVDGRRMPSGMGRIPQLYEGIVTWRHPLWGNRDRWIAQDPQPTFYKIMRTGRPQVRRAIQNVAKTVAKKLE